MLTSVSRSVSPDLVFIDSQVDDFLELASNVISDTEVIILHPLEDGIAQITSVLAKRVHLRCIHIVSHGRPGGLQLGNRDLTLESLQAYAHDLHQWQKALHPDASILLYGCHVAAGEAGRSFIAQLQHRVGVKIAASSTPVGSAQQGGNWQLDVRTGDMPTPLPFTTEILATYASVLAKTFIDEDFSGTSGSKPPSGWSTDVLTGDPKVDLWRFDNPGQRPLPDVIRQPAAIFDSDKLSDNDQPENVALTSPVFKTSGVTQVFLQFDQKYLDSNGSPNGSEAYVEVYNGKTWQTVADLNEDTFGTTRIDISKQAAGIANTQVRFRYTGNWSQYWAVDNVKVVDALTPGITVLGNPQVSEDNVPDPRNFQFVLNSKPTANVTIDFNVDSSQLKSIRSLTFTPTNWNVPQAATVSAVTDNNIEGENQKSKIKISVKSNDPNYRQLKLKDAVATITERTIPGFSSYRTVEATYEDMAKLAKNHANLASWLDIGDSYDKTKAGGSPGYDLRVLQLTNKAIRPQGGKPTLYVEGGLHAREYSTNEVAARFAEDLVNRYGIDPEITWLLDYFQININPVVNPDGRKFAEQGYQWRKNTNPNPPAGSDKAPFPSYGVDLNRNHSFEWNTVPGGSSGDPSADDYRGTAAASEPETQAVEKFVKTLFPDQRGPKKTDAAPANATGVLIDLHSYGNTVLYPWGSTTTPAPNRDSLRNLGLKFGYYTKANGTPYDVYQAVGLYPTDGATDDWTYGTLGVAAYTWELGTDFFEPSDYFEKSIAPQVIPALTYAAKSAYRPYRTASAPESIEVTTDLPQVIAGTTVTLTAKADGTRYADSNADGLTEGKDLPKPQTITGGRYSIDQPSWIAGTKTFSLQAADGQFNSPVETLTGAIDTRKLKVGRRTLFVESKDTDGQYGVPTATFLDVLRTPDNAKIRQGSDRAQTLTVKTGSQVIYALGGNDTVTGGDRQDILLGGDGNDRVTGNRKNSKAGDDDILYGGSGKDVIGGRGGKDKLYGDDGNDKLYGDRGDDLLWGGNGNDTERGGEGKDTFVLAYGEGTDLIKDFKVNSDRLGLAGTLKFNQLSITQDKKNALIGFGKEVLAELSGVKANALTESMFVSV